ncbi:hypothetical protein [Paracoccus sp. S1E-3]|uniref:hypothetical protein n=1 Tax=Paracoccus sp. S1E-3 TaxID=2756130 RepID=UPI0015EE9DDA|nr:hypothetical protein [Paracoccus sp. S1E-3]MBA4492262.1 hypothetical protein [Paracoccus sp. S1E-3]
MNNDAVRAGNATGGFPASGFYAEFQYIGQFVQTPQGREAISFIGADERPEAELPNIP